jgi:hypothetical protein
LRYRLSEDTLLKASGGLYVQPPQEQEVSSEFGNPNIKAESALHFTIGAEKDFRQGRTNGWVASSDLFLKWLDHLVISSTDFTTQNGVSKPTYYSNDGKGKIIGIQNQIKYSDLDWVLTLNYTLEQSLRWSSSEPVYPSKYDQTHVLGLVASRELGNNWKLSGRFRFVTGNPTTPVNYGIFDSDEDVYLPVRGALYSQRLPNFRQLDLRLDKKWIYDTWILSLYLDIQNITNETNVEQVQYSYNYKSQAYIAGLPILPTLGLKGEF